MRDEIVSRVIEKLGGEAALAAALGIKTPSIYDWQRVPPKRVHQVAKLTGFAPHELRGDIFEAPAEQAAA